MTIKADRLGPGTLTLGEVGSTREFGSQVSKLELTPDDSDGDALVVLDGQEMTDDADDSATLEGEFYQEYGMDSLVKWCWDHHRDEMPFTFVPDTAGALTVSGICRIMRVNLGGDVKKRNTAKFAFPIVGNNVTLAEA